ncbi:MAG: DUF4097 family beta strand repeat protein [Oscillibacter sp.]|nr:DUF4097 family beta strand repeat protein [Oscillibacter sp.]
MTRAQFLNDLYHHLYGLSKEQAEQHLTYYAEMLADRMEEGMTEEEAVAGMENVETIARRIMEEENLPYTPPENRPPVPPEYPDASKLQGGGGKRAYQAPRKANWRRIAQIVLWVVAIAAAAGAVRQWMWGRNYDTPRANAPIDRDTAIAEVAAPEAPYAEWYEEYYMEAPYEEGYEYDNSGTSFSERIDCIDIQWASGVVYIQSSHDDEVYLCEYTDASTGTLSERTALSCQVDDGTLTIRYRSGTGLGNVRGGKWLTVLVPDGMLDSLNIVTTSADIRLNGLELGTLSASTTSGYVTPAECYVRKAELASISGEMLLTELHAEELNVNTASGGISGRFYGTAIEASSISGDVYMDLYQGVERARFNTTSGDIWVNVDDSSTRAIGIGTVSGDISLNLPYDMGFTLGHTTVSGGLTLNTDYDLLQQDGRYIHNGGGCEIEVETVSGDFEIY